MRASSRSSSVSYTHININTSRYKIWRDWQHAWLSFMLAKLVRIHNSANRVLERRRVPKAGWGWAQRGGNHRLERKGERERQVDLFKEWGVGESNFNGFWECTPFSLSLQSCPFPGFPCALSPYFLYSSLFLSPCLPLPEIHFPMVTRKHEPSLFFDRQILHPSLRSTQIKVLFMLSGIK